MAEQPPEIPNWIKALPVAPEFRPTLEEFDDPISYILKIEKEASKYGICKIIPPVAQQAKKTVITNLTRSFAARNPTDKSPTFTTRCQQVGFCPRKPRPFQRPVWQSGETYTLQEFEAKAKVFEKNYLKRSGNGNGRKGKGFSPLEIETLFWRASVDKPFNVEYANDIPGSAFVPINIKKWRETGGEAGTVGETAWNMRGVSRAEGSLLRFMKEEISGVTSPMVYLAMLFSWFAWHVEDHDLHSLNYMHLGAGKTWYGVPRDAGIAFTEVVRVHGYGGEVNPLVTFATLGQKTTVMSPEVFIGAGIPCCRLVQNIGEFVVTFPGAYHSGFSHGFNCGEASNIATPGWLRFAKEAAIRRACINYPPMLSHLQLLYELALTLSTRVPMSIRSGPRSSRLKEKKRREGETIVKELFVKNEIQNNELLFVLLEQGISCVVLPQNSSEIFLSSSNSRVGSERKVKPRLSLGLCSNKEPPEVPRVNTGPRNLSDLCSVKGRSSSVLSSQFSQSEYHDSCISTSIISEMNYVKESSSQRNGLLDQGLISCVTCGILSFACAAIVQPKEVAAQYLMSSDCIFFNDSEDGSESPDRCGANEIEYNSGMNGYSGNFRGQLDSDTNGLYDVPIKSGQYQVQVADQRVAVTDTETQKVQKAMSSLDLLASTYGNSSDSDEEHSDEEQVETEFHHKNDFRTCSPMSDCSLETAMRMERIGCGEENKSSNTNILIKNTNTPIVQKYDGDSSRKHIFCLEHAVEAEKQLRPFGGVDMLVLCHPEYPKIESEAKSLAEELGINYLWNEIDFRNATISDERVIRSALNDEEAIPSSRDWAVKLGINLSSSSSLGFSPLYAKQMPHNSIIHKAFGNNSPTNSPTQSKAIVKGKKGVVAGKWCGKIWMSNQVHPYLSHRDTQEKQPKRVSVRSNDAQEHSRNFNSRKKDAQEDDARNINAPPVSTLKQEIIQYTRRKTEKPVLQEKNSLIGKKRKETFREDTAKRSKSLPEEDSSSESISSPPRVRTRRSVQTNHETTKLHGKILKTTRKCDSNLKPESEGGPSTRLRRRPPKPDVDNKVKPKGEKRTKKKKAKTPATLDVATGGDETKEEEADYQCNVDGCNMGFGTKQELMLHKRNICSVKGCGKKFFSHKYLVQHKRVHIDDRPLKCPWKGCKMAFKWAWARTEHIRVHTGVRPYLCRVPGCGQTFRFVSDFSRHKRKTGHLVKGKK